ncbi:outer membrane protein assembly factor BamB family protein [Streptomyces justiciae]|uniref:PQQ-binding-like beta-propeller repeat protein n=1 Tax=Streptomyces justiciae TaxID=2780140 RepID=A0ABU3LJW2_9ACTN|nr:PQQ-binding-like beta-propeller repeat protein [Streptomyces justiciae]MDT7839443.1 PQQ-binding-like beta-propeller repeat protein [Streptomyces justiciae]
MTQPPPPPNQPPPGGSFGPPQDQPPQPAQQPGFGAPQDQPPQQPGFGAPQTSPQPQPGYGYPQAPQAPQTPPPPQGPPQTPPGQGYGYPGQPQQPYGQPPAPAPNPYGQPQPDAYGQQPGGYGQPQPNAYGQQPGYGYQQPTMPLQPQAGQPAGGRKINSQLAIIVAAVVAIALIVGGGLWYANSSGDDGKKDTANSSGGTGGGGDEKGGTGGTSSKGEEKVPANTAASVLFQVPQPEVKEDTTYTVNGSWLTDTVYAKSGIAEVVGYDPDKGTELWTIKLPGPVCAASRQMTDKHLTAIAYEPAMPTKEKPTAGCSQVSAIDLDAGKQLWTKTAKTGDRLIPWDNVTVSANTVATGSTSGGAAWDITTGKSLWEPKPTDSCYDAGYGGGAKLVAVRKCGDYDARQLHIQTIDPASGKVISEYKMSQGIEYASIVSTEPLVVAAEVGEDTGASGISDVFSIDNKTGKLRTRISLPGDEYAAKCDGIYRTEYCFQIAVGNDRVYVPTEEHQGAGSDYSRTNEIIAFDLATGKQTGQRADAGDGYTISPLRMDGGNLIAYKRPPYDKGGQVVSIDGGTFKETKLLENPATESVRDVETSMLPESSELIYHDGRLFMSEVYASDFGSSTGEKEYLAIAFGAK